VRITETATGKSVAGALTLPDGVREASFSPDGRRVYAKNLFGQARLWDAITGQPVTDVLTHGGAESWSIRADAFSADGKELVLVYCSDSLLRPSHGGTEVVVRGWDAGSGLALSEARKLDAHVDSRFEHPISTDARRVLVTTPGREVRLFDAHSGQLIGPPLPVDRGVYVSQGSSADPLPGPFGPNGRVLLAYMPSTVALDQSRGEARLWDASTGRALTPPMMLAAPMREPAFSADGRRLLLLEGGKTARVWDTATGRPLTPPLGHGGQLMRAVLSTDGAYLLTAAGNEARVWDASSGRPLTPLLVHNGAVHAARFSPEGAHLLTASQDGTARLWPMTAGAPPSRSLEHDGPVENAIFSTDGYTIVTATEYAAVSQRPAEVLLWDAFTGQPLSPAWRPKDRQDGWPPSTLLSPDRRWLAALRDKEVQLYDAATGQPSGAPLGLDAPVYRVRFTPDSRGLLTLQERSRANDPPEVEVVIWDVATRQARHSPVRLSLRPSEALFSPDGARLVLHSSSPRQQAQLLDSQTGLSIIPPTEVAGAPAFSQDSNYLALATPSQTVEVRDAKTGQMLGSPLVQSEKITAVRFLVDSRTLLTLGAEKIRRWDVVTSRPIGPDVELAKITPQQLSPDGQYACVRDGTEVRVLDLTTGRPATPALKHPAHVSDARFTPDGRALLTFSGATTVESHLVYFVRPDGLQQASSYRSLGEVRLWDALTGEPLAPPQPHLARGQGLLTPGPTISADGRRLLLSSAMRTLEVWDVPDPDPRSEDELVQLAQALSGRRFDEVAGPQPLGAKQWALARLQVPDAASGRPFDFVSWHRREAIRCIDDKEWSTALRHLDPLIAARPTDWRAYYMRGSCRLGLGAWEAGVADSTRAIELGADDFRCWNNRAHAHFGKGNWKEAAADCETVRVSFPASETIELATMHIRACARLGDAASYRRACTNFVKRWGIRLGPNDLAWACVLAPDALADMGEVVQLAEKAYKQSPTPMVRNTLGAALYRAGKWEEAVKTLDQNQGESAAYDWLFLAMAHHRLGHADQAREYLEKATAWLDAAMWNNATRMPSSGELLRSDQRAELPGLRLEAECTLHVPPEQFKAQESVFKQRLQARAAARQLADKRHWAEAIRVLDGLIEADGDYRPDWVARGDAHFELGQWEKAAADYARALELKTTAKDLETIAYRLAVLRVNLGDTDGYRRTCAALLEQLKETKDSRAAYHLARICALGPGGLADYAPAVRLAQQGVAATPKGPWTLHTLGAVYYRAGQWDKAIESLRASLDASPNYPGHPCNWLMLALAYRAKGEEDEVRRWLDKATAWLETVDPKAPNKSLHPLPGLHPHDAWSCQLLRWEVTPLLPRPTDPKKDPR
jgi:WD40 repeat protein/tetratricopeptide (TPR) repeat protein